MQTEIKEKQFNRQRCKSGIKRPDVLIAGRVRCWRVAMSESPQYCPHPGDLKACADALVRAWQKGHLSEHCIMKGLAADHQQCKLVLQSGLYPESRDLDCPIPLPLRELFRGKNIREACREIVLTGYPKGIKSIREIFYDTYYKLVRYVILKYGIRDDGIPSADEISQETFLAIHIHLSRGNPVDDFVKYIIKVALNECKKPFLKPDKHVGLTIEEETIQAPYSAVEVLPPEIVYAWKHEDWRLLNSKEGSLINRIILAHRCIDGWSQKEPISAKSMKTDWARLKETSQNEIIKLYNNVVFALNKSPSDGPVPLVASFINTKLAQSYQTAVVFGTATGMYLKGVNKLISKLDGLSEGAIHARISRIISALRPPDKGDK